jgi:predicted O-linked N-acetylglucosamine transferase (SPINDLY family)
MSAPTLEQTFQLGLQHHQAGRLAEAEALYRQILASDPKHPDALHMLGVLANQLGRANEAADLIRQAIRLDPTRAIYHNNLGLVFAGTRQWAASANAFRAALSINPSLPQALNNFANVQREMGQLDEALSVVSKAVALDCATPETLGHLGLALANRGRMEEAIRLLGKSVALRPDPDVLLNLGNTLKWQGRLDESNTVYQRAIQLRPEFAAAHLNLATNFCSQALLDDALNAFSQAIRFGGDDAQFQSGYIHALHYHPNFDAGMILQEHLAWADRFAEPLTHSSPPHHNDRSPERRLKLAYVSPDFRDHPVGRFLLPLFSHHDQQQFEVCCYSSSRATDEVTETLRGSVDQWTEVGALSDEQLTQKIREDRIDILVDLSLHTAGNRLLAFARNPAPVQVTWLAYPGTSGMSAMKYRLSDSYLDPPGCDVNYREKTVRLPACFWCYHEPASAPPVNPLPALREGRITFGCFNNFFKASTPILELWAQVLAAVSLARMLIHSQPGSHLDRVRAIFAQAGVSPDRLEFFEFLPPDGYWRQHHRIDIALDTSPYAGGTTTCDSLWMGVPVVTLASRTAVGRAGASILTNAGLAELVAQTPHQYVEIATRLAADLDRLASLRGGLRSQVLHAPLMDAGRFVTDIEAAFRGMWRAWCEAESGETVRAD